MPFTEGLLEMSSAQASDDFDCDVHRTSRAAAWLRLSGELDLAAAPRLAAVLEDALASAWLVVVDLRDLTFIDSSGLAVIRAADDRARRSERRLVLIRGPAQVSRLIDLAGSSDRFRTADLTPGQSAR